MGVDVIRESIQKARKEYCDDGLEWIDQYISDKGWSDGWLGGLKPSFADFRILVWIKNNRKEASRIFPGQRYISQFNNQDGEVFTYRTKTIFHDICVKLKLYQTD